MSLLSIVLGTHALSIDDLRAETVKDDFNIVLITIDTLRADHLSCYGYKRPTSPAIDKIAKKGVLFRNVIAPSSWTAPSMVSLFTSTYPINHGVVHGLKYRKESKKYSQEVFSPDLITLPETLKKQGYTTFGVSSNHNLTAEFGFARGFDYFQYHRWATADRVNKTVYSWKDRIEQSEKYFLWVHYIDPHRPYNARSPWINRYSSQSLISILRLSKESENKLTTLIPSLKDDPQSLASLIALYDSEINYVDAHLGELIETFELEKNTLLIITSDHGEEFLEHTFLGHSYNLHQETINIPLVIKLPHRSQMSEVKTPANLVDIMPTILHKLAIDPPGQSLGTSILEKGGRFSRLKNMFSSTEKSVYSFAELDKESVLKAIVTPGGKYIYDYGQKTEQLYNVKSDPLELNNLVGKETEQSNQLKAQLFDWVSSSKEYYSSQLSIQLSPEERKKLEALGYLEEASDMDNDRVPDGDDSSPAPPNGLD
jgi:arylsulfatase A-like enzyme